MAEIAINTIIRIVLVLVVIIVLLVGFFMFWRNYIFPYLSGLGKEVGGFSLLCLKNKKKVLKI